MTTPTRALAATVLAALALTLTACGSGSDSESVGASADAPRAASGGAAVPEQAPGLQGDGAAGRDAGATDSGGTGVTGVNRTVVAVRSVIRTGNVAVTNKDVVAARTDLADVVARFGGAIDSEQTQSNSKGRIVSSTVTVRVPVDRFDEAMTALGGLGKVRRADSSSKDVTSEVIDVDERVQTLAQSLDRLQKFQDQATSIDDLIRYENEITRREAELQSMRSQQAYLRDQTAMSTITVSISLPPKQPVPPKEDSLDDAGFLIGLKSGWTALRSAVVVVLTIVGALLPFAVVLLLVGVPTWLLVRRMVVRGKPAPPAATTPTE
ncbi:DUF4349 domain-containing protein [Nocardioides iriomotensis]|nr:DUF4349 domain-containing protein [Nocardioides iriomotensis]